MRFLSILLVLALVLSLNVFYAVGLFGLLMTLLVAGVVGWAADAVVPGKLPGGWLGAVLAGIVGGWLGALLFALLHLPRIGPDIAGVDVVPAFIGALVIVGGLELISTRRPLS
jgi:uncharacterized membrane protein YeaQ/YmgE (transglycosylase-associated protein family)